MKKNYKKNYFWIAKWIRADIVKYLNKWNTMITGKLRNRKLTFRLKLIVHTVEDGPSGFKSKQLICSLLSYNLHLNLNLKLIKLILFFFLRYFLNSEWMAGSPNLYELSLTVLRHLLVKFKVISVWVYKYDCLSTACKRVF